jgi:hypothetical protein
MNESSAPNADSRRRQTAIHEAGHAVAFYRLFENFRMSWYVTIVPDPDDDTLGHHAFEGDFSNPDRDSDHETCSCAGYGAVRASGQEESEATWGCGFDFENVRSDLEAAKARALDLMTRPENVRAVQRLADELLSRETIPGDEIEVLIDVADGELSEEDFQRFLLLKGSITADEYEQRILSMRTIVPPA